MHSHPFFYPSRALSRYHSLILSCHHDSVSDVVRSLPFILPAFFPEAAHCTASGILPAVVSCNSLTAAHYIAQCKDNTNSRALNERGKG